MRKTRLTYLLAAAGLVGALGGLPVAVSSAGAASRSVHIADDSFGGTIRIDPGDTVRWTNDDDTEHTVAADDREPGGSRVFDSGDMSKDETYSHTFPDSGTFTYFCRHHDDMKGRVEVSGPPTTEPPSTTSSSTTTTGPPTTTTTVRAPDETLPPPADNGDGRNDAPPTTTASPPPTTTETTPPDSATSTSTSSSTSSSTTTSSTSTTSTTAAPAPVGGEALPSNIPSTTGPPAEADGEEGAVRAQAATVAEDGGSPRSLAATLSFLVLLGCGGFAVWSLLKFRPGRLA